MSKAARRASTYGYVVIAAGFIIWLVGGSKTAVFSVLLKPVLADFNWSQADASLGYSLAIMVQGFMAIIMGQLTDKLGPRIVVSVFGSFLGISYILLSQINALWQYQLYYGVVSAIGSSVMVGPVMATVARWFDKRRGLMMGIVQAGTGFSGLIFAPLAAWVTLNYDWRLAYAIVGLTAGAGMVLGGLLLKRRPVENLPTEFGSRTGSTRSQGATPPPPPRSFSLRGAFKTRKFWIIAGLFFSFGFCRSAFMPFTAPLVQERGFSLTDGANVVAALTVASIFGRLAMGRVSDSIGNRRALFIGEVMTTGSLALGIFVTNLPGLYLYAIVFGFGWGAQAVLRFAVTSEAFGLASVASIMGALGLGEAIGASLGTIVTGRLFDITGGYSAAFWVGIGVSLVGIVLAPFEVKK